MRITQLRATNFESYPLLETSFAAGPSCIVGKNMSGKTTVARALCWGLCAQFPYPGLSRFTKELVSPNGDTSLETSVSLRRALKSFLDWTS